ncbi:2-oxo acid dehydrogenase subunit E2 [Streptomyces sp. NPDC048106]|uniref:2-oxo acid dehydrogenase subunit E2 n=1 Tax=Streptomyces sp. NPDC048106 TaxID=3155750 RepID=UPI003451BE25
MSTSTPRGGIRQARPPQPGSTVRLSRVRKIIAARMTESLQVSAQLTAVQEADVTAIATLRKRAKESFRAKEGASLTFLPFFARALVAAAREFPSFNASIDPSGESVTYHEKVHLGVAVDGPGGLMVPVIRDADELTVPELAVRIADLAARVRDGSISMDELSGSTLTLTNIGSAGSLTDTPILNQPEVAILGTGAVTRRPRVVTDEDGTENLAIRSVCSLPLTYDHRLIDGADAGRFLSAIVHQLRSAPFETELAGHLGTV